MHLDKVADKSAEEIGQVRVSFHLLFYLYKFSEGLYYRKDMRIKLM